MFVSKGQLFIGAFFYFLLQSQGLKQVFSKEENIIIVSESIIRNVTSELFLQLNLKGVKLNKKLRQFVIVHKFFTTVTLNYHKTINKIVRLTRTDKHNVKNETKNLMELLNEILNDDLNTDDNSIAIDEDVVQYIDEFLSNINGFKESTGFNNNYESLEIKDEIFKILNSDTNKYNVSNKYVKTSENGGKEALFSDNEYWEPNTRRIFDGKSTKIRNFPFMASIHIFNSFQCGGSIINSNLIITAASCLQLVWNNRMFHENPALLGIRVGSNFYKGGGDYIKVLEIYFHPDYNPKSLENNIALLRLSRHLNFRKSKKRMKKIEFDKKARPLPVDAKDITIVGWGAKSGSNSNAGRDEVSYSVLDVYGFQDCQEIYSKEYVTHKHFCGGFVSKGSGACNHDIGGPGIINGILTGIISFGSPVCGTPDTPTVFTKVGYYSNWIQEFMYQDVTRFNQWNSLRQPLFDYMMPPLHSLSPQFLIPPILDDVIPIPFAHVNNLKILKNEGKFKEFLSTIFKSNEDNEYPIKDNLQKMFEINLIKKNMHEDETQSTESLSSEERQYLDIPIYKKNERLNGVPTFGNNNYSISNNLLAGITDFKTSDHIFGLDTHSRRKYRPLNKYDDTAILDNNNLSLNDYLMAKMTTTTEVTKKRVQMATHTNKQVSKPFIVYSETRDMDLSTPDEEAQQNFMKETIARIKAYKDKIYLGNKSDDEINVSSKNIKEGLSIPVDRMSDEAFRNNLTHAILNIMRDTEFSDVLNKVLRDMRGNK